MSKWDTNYTGEPPFSKGTLVDVIHRDGSIHTAQPCGVFGTCAYMWSLDGDDVDIVAYRLHNTEDGISKETHDQLIRNAERDVGIFEGMLINAQERLSELKNSRQMAFEQDQYTLTYHPPAEEEWKPGDVVECVLTPDEEMYTVGHYYTLEEHEGVFFMVDENEEGWASDPLCFRKIV